MSALNSEWPNGEWDNEPDELAWTDDATGLKCKAHRNILGAWCGYVAVPKDHVHFGCGYDAFDVIVHGGLTYAQVYPDGEQWVGFDCAHGDDLIPGMEALLKNTPYAEDWKGTYRNLDFVRSQCERLAVQLYEQV